MRLRQSWGLRCCYYVRCGEAGIGSPGIAFGDEVSPPTQVISLVCMSVGGWNFTSASTFQ